MKIRYDGQEKYEKYIKNIKREFNEKLYEITDRVSPYYEKVKIQLKYMAQVCSGRYDQPTNTIIISLDSEIGDPINPNLHDMLTYSLLSAAASGDKNLGFKKKKKWTDLIPYKSSQERGIALNLGYIEMLNLRYFTNEPESVYYKEEREVVELIEKIVGEKDMRDSFFRGDLNSIIIALSQYEVDQGRLLAKVNGYKKDNKSLNNIEFCTNITDNNGCIQGAQLIKIMDQQMYQQKGNYNQIKAVLEGIINSEILSVDDEQKIKVR